MHGDSSLLVTCARISSLPLSCYFLRRTSYFPTGFGDAVEKGDAPSADSFSISVDQFDGFSVSAEGSAVALDAGATATLASFNWLQNGNALLKKNGSPATEAHPAKTKFNFGIIRIGGLALLGMSRRELRVVTLSPPRLWQIMIPRPSSVREP